MLFWIGLVACFAFVFTRLGFVPVPWADGSAFYLPGMDLLSASPVWRMHAQAAFVPSYDTANFNTMPGLPILLAAADRLGLSALVGATLSTRLVSVLALLFWATLLWKFLRGSKLAWLGAFAIVAAGFFDPILRWGTLVVRTETWIGLAWIYLLIQISRLPERPSSRDYWKMAGTLAFSAYMHFEAIFLLPGVAVGLAMNCPGLKPWIGRCLQVGARTLVFLTPWLLYVALHWSIFWEQMGIQFLRLAHDHPYLSSPYSIFHSLFISLGSAVTWPKFYNIAKGLFWILIVTLTGRTLFALVRQPKREVPLLAAGAAFFSTVYLWGTKPEVWFITLCHLMLWVWLAAAVVSASRALRGTLIGLAAISAVLNLGATLVQHAEIPKAYSWANYRAWSECIDQTIRREASETARVWQPDVPDVLVELRSRNPRYDLTRSFDFPDQAERVEAFARTVDAIVLTRLIPTDSGTADYQGPARAQDSSYRQGPGRVWICQNGPFFSAVQLASNQGQ